MSEGEVTGVPAGQESAGAILRAAREKQGVHIAVLAASIKVPRPKLEALEGDRYDELPDITFTRALAKTVSRALKIDAEPVLARLPEGGTHRLKPIGSGLNMPYREYTARRELGEGWSLLRKPMFWVVGAVLLATAVLYLLPDDFWRRFGVGPSAAPASAPVVTSAASAPGAGDLAPQVVVETVHAVPTLPASLSAPEAAPAGIAVLRATGESLVEVHDARGQPVLSRMLQAGETVGIDGALPLQVKIGNVAVMQLSFKGQAVDLTSSTRDNIARLVLK